MTGTAADMPNANVPNSWSSIGTIDVGDGTFAVDCATGILSGSSDSGAFARGVSGQGLSQTVTGLTIGATYFVQFEQSRILNFGRATGHWEVTMFASALSSSTITDTPASDPGQTAWEQAVVGPFVATATSTTLSFVVQTDSSGSDPFGGANISGACAYPREIATADLTIDAVRVFEDEDSDGDGQSNRLDADDDNDGILDTDEGYQLNSATTFTLDTGASVSGAAADGARLVYTDVSGNAVVFDLAPNATYGFAGAVGGATVMNATLGSVTYQHDGSNEANMLVYTVSSTPGELLYINSLNFTNFFDIDSDVPRDSFAFDVPGGWTNTNGLSIYQLDDTAIDNATVISGDAIPASVDFQPQIDAGAVSEVIINVNEPSDTNNGDGWSATFNPSVLVDNMVLTARDVEGAFLIIGGFEATTIILSSESSHDSDEDGVPDHLDLDSDNDGISDLIESGQSAALHDADNNGSHDDLGETYTNGVPDDANGGAGVTPVDSFDTAGDSLSDLLDLDSDDDGIPDAIEAQASATYVELDESIQVAGLSGVDANGVSNGQVAAAGLFVPTDSDGDGTPDYLDLNSDDHDINHDGDSLSDASESGGAVLASTADTDGGIDPAIPSGLANNGSEFDFRYQVRASIDDPAMVAEGSGGGSTSLVFTVSLDQANSADTQIPFTVSGGTGASASPITVLAGNTSVQLTVTTAADTTAEPHETVTVTLQAPTETQGGGAFLTTTAADQVGISGYTDDDLPSAPTVSINDAGDGRLNAAEIAAGVTADITLPVDALAGDTLEVDTDSDNIADVAVVLSATDITNGVVTINVPGGDVPANGTLQVDASIANGLGNGPEASDSSIADSAAPGAPAVSINDGGDGRLNAMEIAAGVSADITLPAGSVAGDTLSVDTDGDSVADVSVVLSGTDVTNGTVTINVPGADVPANGTLTVTASLTDVAGNVGPQVSDSSTTDSRAPLAPTVQSQTTLDNTPQITGATGTGAALNAGETLLVTVNGATYSVVPDAAGDWSFDTGVDVPVNGTLGSFDAGVLYPVTATISDAAGNTVDDATTDELAIGVDSDGDGIASSVETAQGTDPNDPDSDNDGLSDGDELGPNGIRDAGETDALDADSDDDGLADGTEVNGSGLLDEYGPTDPLDADSDDDGIGDGVEAGASTGAVPAGTSDGNGTPYAGTAAGFVGDADPATSTDPLDADSDDDGLDDGVEDADADGATINALGGTGSGGAGETSPNNPDTDGDGLSDGDETNATGPLSGGASTNPLDADTDDGGTRDGTEVLADSTNPSAGNGGDDMGDDSDGDGLSDAQEAIIGTDPIDPDTDNDGIDDGAETGHDGVVDGSDTDPLDSDSDDDGLSDGAETLGPDELPGSGDETDPLNADSDGDGLADGTESGVDAPVPGGISDGAGIAYSGTDAGAPGYVPDADPGTTTDPTDADSDDDGLIDGVEDSNGDGASINTVGDTGSSGSGETDPNNPDTDGDHLIDGDERAGSGPLTGMGATDPLDTDTDDGGIDDGVEAMVAATNPTAGNAGDDSGTDSDGDGLDDALELSLGTDPDDADSDNDGIDDGAELGGDGVRDSQDTDPLDADTDDDGLADGDERLGSDGLTNTGDETDPLLPDSDHDGVSDGTEIGVQAPVVSGTSDGASPVPFAGTDTGSPNYLPDADPATTTDPNDPDSDDDALTDGFEDANANGAVDGSGVIAGTGTTSTAGDETDPNNPDTDGDGLLDGNEVSATGPLSGAASTDPLDSDTDNDELNDGDEVLGTGALAGIGVTDPNNPDTDGGGTNDGTELSLGLNPTVGNSADDVLDDDMDGTGDDIDADPADPCVPDAYVAACDSDMDGITDGEENDAGTDPDNPDTDGDGLSDGDEFGMPAGGGAQDTDNDGVPDAADADSDNDGIPDAQEAGDPMAPRDSDEDGTPDYQDLDSDADGIPDAVEGGGDNDMDGRSNATDPDADDDGIPDVVEDRTATGTDTDGDGLDDAWDVDATGGEDANNDGVDDALDPTDTDTDSLPDYLDIDADDDGIEDAIEADTSGMDSDGDGLDDSYDPQSTGGVDNNGDGVDDAVQPTNTDADSAPDYVDLDADNDGVNDVLEAGLSDADDDGLSDGGALVATPPDTDNDGAADYRDLDSNNDGEFDAATGKGAALDANGDGVLDDITDADNDGIADPNDAAVGIFGTSNDTDNDGIADAGDLDDDNDGIVDTAEGDGAIDTDGDGVPDSLDSDSDNDGVPDVIEASTQGADVDNDGVVDNFVDANNDGLHDGIDAGMTPVDTDGDNTPDFQDLDADGDGLFDLREAGVPAALDSNGDGIIDASTGNDMDGDGLDDAVDGVIAGALAGAPALVPDTDNDGASDYRDLDSDGDGFTDAQEDGDFDNDNVGDQLQPTGGELETAVTGAGAMGWLSLAWLLGLLSWRYRAVRQPPTAACSRGLRVLAVSGVMSTMFIGMPPPAAAADPQALCGIGHNQGYGAKASDAIAGTSPNAAIQNFRRCFYGGLNLGITHVDPEGSSNGWSTDDNSSTGFGISAGYHFRPRWFAELSWVDAGQAGLANANPALDALAPDAAIDYSVPTLMAGYYLLDNNRPLNVYAKLGVSVITNASNSDLVGFERQSSVQFAGGIGASWRLDQSPWFVRTEFTSYDRDANMWSLMGGRYFGGRDNVQSGPQAQYDDDGDGVSNIRDFCPGTDAGDQVDAKGCLVLPSEVLVASPPENAQRNVVDAPARPNPATAASDADADRDKVLLANDRCPSTPFGVLVDVSGCAIKQVFTLRPMFDTRSTRLSDADKQKMAEIAGKMRYSRNLHIQVEGHTDNVRIAPRNRHEFANNQVLSLARARAVAEYLQGLLKVQPDRVQISGRGPNQPVASNRTAAGRAQNRRVEVRVAGQPMAAEASTENIASKTD